MSDGENGPIQMPGNNNFNERISTGGGADADDGDIDGGIDDLDYKDDEERDVDSLTIKPPQAVVSYSRDRELGRHGRGKEKIRSKEKKHSKDRKHKERNSLKEREREQREHGVERIERGGGGRAEYIERYPPRLTGGGGGFDDSHEPRRSGYGGGGGGRHFEGGPRSNHYHIQQQQAHYHHHQQQQQYHHMQHLQQRHHDYYERNTAYHNNRQPYGGGGKHYHEELRDRRNERSHEMLHERDMERGERIDREHREQRDRDRDRDRDRRKYNDKQPAKDAESLEQDLRSRLLSKRHKYVRGSGGGADGEDEDERHDEADEYEKERSSKSVRRAEKKRSGSGVIELLDSPDAELEDGEYKSSRRRHKSRKKPPEDLPPATNANTANSSDKRKTPDDPELLARRARFLAAEREKELRKESAREELQARRELLRERERKEHSNENALSPSAVAASVTAGLNVIKRKSSGNPAAEQAQRKRKRINNASYSGEDEHQKSVSGSGSDDESDSDDDDDEDDTEDASENSDDHSRSENSAAAESVKSVSPKLRRHIEKKQRSKRHKQRQTDSEEEEHSPGSQSDEASAHDDGQQQQFFSDVEMADDVSSGERDTYVKRKSKKKRRRKHASLEMDRDIIDPERPSAAASANDSRSISPAESVDSFYAKRKREKRPKPSGESTAPSPHDDGDSSVERAYYKVAAVKSKKPKRKTKSCADDIRAAAAAAADVDDEYHSDENASAISDGSVKAHRARKRRHKRSSSASSDEDENVAGDEAKSPSRSDSEAVESDANYYKKKHRQRHRRHHHHRRQRKSGHNVDDDHDEVARKAKWISSQASDVSSESSEDDFENGLKHAVDDSDESMGKDDNKSTKRKRRSSDDASQFMADINEEEIFSARKDKDTIDASGGSSSGKHLHSHSRSSRGNGTMSLNDDKELETVYDDKGEPLPNYYPGIQGCRTVEEFQCLNRIEEGTYGVVYRARDQRTNEIVALKRLKMEKEREGFPITSLREINTLLKGQHPNIVTVREIVVGSNLDKIYIVMDYVEHDLKSLMETMKVRKQIFFPGEVKCLAQQLMRAVSHLHDNWILHRDLKTSNLLLSHKGILKVGDFGLAREYGSPLRKYTSLVVTRWYRAPELLLCSPMYSTPIDIWSVGCIFAEFLLMTPYLPGKSDIDQLNKIFKELGTPNEKIWPGYNELPAVKNVLSQNTQFADYPMSNLRKRFKDKVSDAGISLLQGLLTYDPKQRLTAESALDHAYFKELPLPIDPAMFPTWPAKSEMGSTRKTAHSPQPPSGGAQFKQLGQDDYAAAVKTTVTGGGGGSSQNNKVVSGIITGNKKTATNTGFVLNAGNEQRQLAMGPGFNLKF